MKIDTDLLFHAVIAVLLPPVAVFLKRGAGKTLLISVVLTVLGFVPGVVHALLVVFGKLR